MTKHKLNPNRSFFYIFHMKDIYCITSAKQCSSIRLSNFHTNPKVITIIFMNSQTMKGERYRLSVVVEELKAATTVDYKTALVAFINCIIISAPRLPDRIRVRNEFIGKGNCLFIFVLDCTR
jgi:hypothetical protein